MIQAEKIANQFSDAYLVAMLEGTNTDLVMRHYTSEYPELSDRLSSSARTLEKMYGYLREAETPRRSEVAAAYALIGGAVAAGGAVTASSASAATQTAAAKSPSLISRIAEFFSGKPMVAGLSLGTTMAVIIAVVWQPWATEHHGTVADNHGTTVVTEQHSDLATQGNTPTPKDDGQIPATPEPTFRGDKSADQKNDQKRVQNQRDKDNLQRLSALQLGTPKITGHSNSGRGAFIIKWKAAKNALAYIVEIKRANVENFEPVTQTTQTSALVQKDLPSGEEIQVRIIPVSGEQKGPASDVMNITIP